LISRGAFANPDAQPSPSEVETEVEAVMNKGDTATAMTEGVDNSGVWLSPKAFRAIEAIEKYRRQVQWKELTSAERVFENFDYQVNARDKTLWLKGDERQTCYEIVLWPRYSPGEKVVFDVHPKVCRRKPRSVVI
jgi:expansin (peptidoglycan-binding protein)